MTRGLQGLLRQLSALTDSLYWWSRFVFLLIVTNSPSRLLNFALRRKIVFGPFLGELGIELLYWAPTVNYIISKLPRGFNIIVISRGSMQDWYLQSDQITYLETHDYRSVSDLENERLTRLKRFGMMKQLRLTAFERDLLTEMTNWKSGLLVHPRLLGPIFRKFWDSKTGVNPILRRMIFGRPKHAGGQPGLPNSFSCIRLYERETFRIADLDENGVEIIQALAPSRLVSLETGQQYDDHIPRSLKDLDSLEPLLGTPARENLGRQTQLVAGSDLLISTHGGAAYLGLMCGVNTVALETGPTGIPGFHTNLALEIARRQKVSFSILRLGSEVK